MRSGEGKTPEEILGISHAEILECDKRADEELLAEAKRAAAAASAIAEHLHNMGASSTQRIVSIGSMHYLITVRLLEEHER